MANKLIAIVGMCGSGKGVACSKFESWGYQIIYFGQITLDEVEKRGLPPGEASERIVREQLRTEHGMAAYAILNVSRIRKALKQGNVVIDGLYSWDELLVLRKEFPRLKVVCIHASPKIRKKRLAKREIRPLTAKEVDARDQAEIERSAKGGPIAVADFMVINEAETFHLHGSLAIVRDKLNRP